MGQDERNEDALNGPPPDIEDFLAALAGMSPPTTPAGALANEPAIEELVRQFDPARAIDILAGLLTDARFQANNIRLELAVRLVIGLSSGSRRPKATDLNILLNSQLENARTAWLEDPIEDFFVESIVTHQGEFHIFSGTWEKAAPHTEAVLNAFRRLPDGAPKELAIRQAFALLRLSDELVRRSGHRPGTIGGGNPQGELPLPSDSRLAALAARTRFSASDLKRLRITEDDLRPFYMGRSERDNILDAEPGNSGLEFRPLFRTQFGLVIAVPSNISTAVRAHLITVATQYSLQKRLQFELFNSKADLLDQSSFRFIPSGKTNYIDDLMYCDQTFEISKGRYLHIFFSIDSFEGWPDRAFGSVTASPESFTDCIVERMRAAKAGAEAAPGFQGGMTLWMTAGWGAGRSFSFSPPDDLDGWMFAAAEPTDIAIMTTCEDGALSDIWRLERQHRLVEEQGFRLVNVNGLLNLFHWWRTTDHALIPPREIDIVPPTTINFDTGLLLHARREAFEKFERRAICDEAGRWHIVARLERELIYQALQHVYGSLNDIRLANLTAVAQEGGCDWWVRLVDGGKKGRDGFETWRTVLIWAGQVMPLFIGTLKKRDLRSPIAFDLTFENTPTDYNFATSAPLTNEQIESGIELKSGAENKISLHLKPEWFIGFNRPDNYAERTLGVKLLQGACKLLNIERTSEELHAIVLQAAGSTDFRHRHAFFVESAMDQLGASGLIEAFSPIPVSAGALAKHDSAWEVHGREAGPRIVGKDACLDFILAFVANCRGKLLREVAKFNKRDLVVAALRGLQSAISNEAHWRRSARALRAIHGVERDFETSLNHMTMANCVLRANSMLAEIASVVSSDGRQPVGRMDIEELQAKALQLFQSSDNYPAFKSGRMDPTIQISPTGDPLYNHDFHEAAIERSARLRHASVRQESSNSYVDRFKKKPERSAPDVSITAVIHKEYGVPLEVFREFSAATASLARDAGTDVMVLNRSRLISELRGIEYLEDMEFSPLIDRLTLPVRPLWDQIPPGFSRRDVDLSKFDRRLSLIARPIICLSSDPDPLLAVAPGVIERALSHNINGAMHGTLQNEFWVSREMLAYAGKAGGNIGLEFNLSLAGGLIDLGFEASPSVKPWAIVNEKSTDEVKRLGDIDVLVVDRKHPVIWVCEAKDLKLCRTLGEAAQRLSEYQGKMEKGKPDKLLRHLQRVDYIRLNAEKVGRQLRLSATPKVCGIVIVNAPQPMLQLTTEYSQDSTVVMFSDIGSVPWKTGW